MVSKPEHTHIIMITFHLSTKTLLSVCFWHGRTGNQRPTKWTLLFTATLHFKPTTNDQWNDLWTWL